MVRRLPTLFAFLLLFAAFATSVSARDLGPEDLNYLTEEYYPYNFADDGEVRGISPQLLRLAWEAMGVPEQPITVYPWARTYAKALQDLETVAFSMARTLEREALFKWACPIDTVRFVLFAPAKGHIRVSHETELDGLRIGTVRGDVSDQALRLLNRVVTIEPVADVVQNIHKLDAGRIDLLAYEERSMRKLLLEMGRAPDTYRPVFLLKQTDICYAFHITTPDALVERFQKALDQVRGTPAYTDLIRYYLH